MNGHIVFTWLFLYHGCRAVEIYTLKQIESIGYDLAYREGYMQGVPNIGLLCVSAGITTQVRI